MKGIQKVLLAAVIGGLSTQAGAADGPRTPGLNLLVPPLMQLSAAGGPLVGRVTRLTGPVAGRLVPIGAPMLFNVTARFAGPYNALTHLPPLPGLE